MKSTPAHPHGWRKARTHPAIAPWWLVFSVDLMETDSDFLARCAGIAHNARPPSGLIDMSISDAHRLFKLAGCMELSDRLNRRKPAYDTLPAHPEDWAALIRLAQDRLIRAFS
jgi:hypothetical protein